MCVFLLLLLVVWICMCVEARQNSLIYFHLTELDLGKWPATAGIPCFHPAQTGVPGAHWGSWCTLGFPVHILGFLVRTGVPGVHTGVPGAHRGSWCTQELLVHTQGVLVHTLGFLVHTSNSTKAKKHL